MYLQQVPVALQKPYDSPTMQSFVQMPLNWHERGYFLGLDQSCRVRLYIPHELRYSVDPCMLGSLETFEKEALTKMGRYTAKGLVLLIRVYHTKHLHPVLESNPVDPDMAMPFYQPTTSMPCVMVTLQGLPEGNFQHVYERMYMMDLVLQPDAKLE